VCAEIPPFKGALLEGGEHLFKPFIYGVPSENLESAALRCMGKRVAQELRCCPVRLGRAADSAVKRRK
jgi:hypothetical protein